VDLSVLPLLEQGNGDIDEIGKLLLGEPKPMTQGFDALRVVPGHPLAFSPSVQFAYSLPSSTLKTSCVPVRL